MGRLGRTDASWPWVGTTRRRIRTRSCTPLDRSGLRRSRGERECPRGFTAVRKSGLHDLGPRAGSDTIRHASLRRDLYDAEVVSSGTTQCRYTQIEPKGRMVRAIVSLRRAAQREPLDRLGRRSLWRARAAVPSLLSWPTSVSSCPQQGNNQVALFVIGAIFVVTSAWSPARPASIAMKSPWRTAQPHGGPRHGVWSLGAELNVRRMIDSESQTVVELWHTTKKDV